MKGEVLGYLDNKKRLALKAVTADLRHLSGYLDSRLWRFSMV
jgi:hypothetical protein